MSNQLDRAGVFRATMNNWGLKDARDTQAKALVIEFKITAMKNDDEWEDWSGYEEHTLDGYFWIVKKTGDLNTNQVEALARAIGWDGTGISTGPPAVECQIVVENETYNGKDRLKVQWINHRDHAQGSFNAAPAEVDAFEAQYGSRLRAATAAVNQGAKPAPPPPASPTVSQPHQIDDGDLPFDGGASNGEQPPTPTEPPAKGGA